ncbi:hypothetical protein L484_020717 [Morus notabilis]|uniref:Uncharacterized protein n=1 Tax=Morus notabilis TaxID=981085 RepID=W9QUE0_9ROSA|nr:uncharacterized protein LOC21403603 [Morus notabilis]EXB40982.1 hypothetical protein L484_020717 [Morus notabilis]
MREEGTSVVRRIDRMSSIESEPRTLRMDQIHFAREAALYVLQTRSMEEAMRIFTEGLEPVVSVVGMKAGTFGVELELVDADNHHHHDHGLQNPELRDAVTAPF